MPDRTNYPDDRSMHRLPGAPSRIVRPLLTLVLILSLAAACSTSTTSTKTATTAATSAATVASVASPAASPSTPAVSGQARATPGTPAAIASPVTGLPLGTPIAHAGTPSASPSSAAADAIKSVIQRANQEQQQAFANQDPAVMQDTATAAYYSQLVQGLQQLANSGVAAIKLDNLQWGDITLQGADRAQATTSETWSTTFRDGSTLQETDTNVYTLVQQGGAWKIASDEHPDTRRLQPPPSTGGTAPPGSAAGAGDSRNWAGYSATGGTFTAVSGTWTVPNVGTGTAPAANATWVGIGGIQAHDLIQAGTDATVQSGQVTYEAWVETLPQASHPVPLTVKPGDSVSVTIAQQPDGSWQIAIHNATSGQTYQTSTRYQSSLSSAEWIEESPAVGQRLLLPLDDFGTVNFTGATTVENGQQRTIAQVSGKPITLASANGQPLAETSALGADGESFSVTRTSTRAPGVAPGTGDVPSETRPS